MKAVQYREYGDADVLEVVEDAPDPHAEAGQVRIAVKAAGVNQADWKMRSGMMGGGTLDQPRIPGFEASGVIDEVGDGVSDVVVGDEVFGSAASGGAAQLAVLGAFAKKPEGMSWEEAAGLPVAVETAIRAIDLLGVADGSTFLINGASGGVGQAAIQFARARGALVIGTASEGNAELLESLGAEATTYGDGLPERVASLAPEGVDFALDAAGHGALPGLIEITGSPDNVVTIADFENAGALGVRATGGGADSRFDEALPLAAELYEKGRFSLPVERTFPLEQIAEAQRVSEQGHARGKLVLLVD